MTPRFALFAAVAVCALSLVAGCGKKSAFDKEFDEYQSSVDAENARLVQDGKDFLARTAKEPGVVVLPSGLMYKVVASPDPKAPQPKPTDAVKINYEGKLVNGTVFDSSYERHKPAVMELPKLVEAWQVGIPLMHKGDTIMLYVPPELGYGHADMGAIPPDSVLVFKIELLDINPKS